MSAKPSIGSFKIISLTEGNPPASVDPTFLPIQRVRLNETIQLWRIKELKDLSDAYRVRLAVGGYDSIGVDKDVVTASIHPEQDIEWVVLYMPDVDAYTIGPYDDSAKGWTVPPDFPANPVIEIKPIEGIDSTPQLFLATQLWRFVKVPGEE